MLSRGAYAVLSIFLLVILQGVALAQTVQDAERVQQQILQREEERRRLEQEQLNILAKEPPAGIEVEEEPSTAPLEEAICFEIQEIKMIGIKLIRESIINVLMTEYIGRCVSLQDINNLLGAITNEYVSRGYITTRAYLPEQDVSDGILELRVVEGTIEGIRLNDGTGKKQNQLLGPFMNLAGKPLNLRDLEQGLDQFNRLPSNRATMEILPGSEPGQSFVAITNEPLKSWRISVGWDDSGQDSTGKNQYLLSFEKANYIGVSDLLFLSYSATPLPWQTSEYPKDSHSFSAYWSLPLGYWTISLSAGRFDYSTPIYGETEVFSSQGETTWQSLGIDRVIHRDADSKTSLGMVVEHRDVESTIEGVRLVAGSYETTEVGIRAIHARRILDGSLSLGLEYYWGEDFLGASEPLEGDDVPTPEYGKWAGTLSYYHPIFISHEQLMWSSILRTQYSPDTLYGAERISIGSRYTVRGFIDDSLSGDSGGYVRNELSWRLPLPIDDLDKIRVCELFVGYDYGMILKDEDDPYERGSVQGMAVGFRVLGELSASITLAKALAAPGFLEKEDFVVYSAAAVSF